MTVEELLLAMRAELREQHREPQFLVYTDVLNRSGMTKEQLRTELNRLYREGKIRVHKGINDKLIEIK